MEPQLEDLEAAASEDELAAERAAARTQSVQSFQRKRPSRKPFPEHLPRERIVIPAPGALPPLRFAQDVEARRGHHRDVGGDPAAVEVIQPVREKFSCRDCETITQPPAPFHVTPRGFAGPNWP